MTNVNCDTCSKELLEDELEENRSKHATPMPGLPTPYKKECKVCYLKRADFDGPNNNFWPNHKKDRESYEHTIKDAEEEREAKSQLSMRQFIDLASPNKKNVKN
tara:strand:+ start:581 stop:892 length:312 start_codon:yes stop_codon:yes gene_type:complete